MLTYKEVLMLCIVIKVKTFRRFITCLKTKNMLSSKFRKRRELLEWNVTEGGGFTVLVYIVIDLLYVLLVIGRVD